MAKLPAFQFYPGDWLKDPALTLCTPAARGVWIDLLCVMHESGRSGSLCGTTDQLARLARCPTPELIEALTVIETTGAADVKRERNGDVTVICRRMYREHLQRLATRQRVKNHRCNGYETGVKRPCNSERAVEDEDSGDLNSSIGEGECRGETARWSCAEGWAGIGEIDRSRWRAAYPACDLDRQLAAMDAWLRANPKKAHKSNWTRFVANWLSRSQDRGGDVKSNGKPAATFDTARAEKYLQRLLTEHQAGTPRRSEALGFIRDKLTEAQRNDSAISSLAERFLMPVGARREAP